MNWKLSFWNQYQFLGYLVLLMLICSSTIDSLVFVFATFLIWLIFI